MEIEYTANLARYGESLAEYNRRAYVMESSETENMKHVLRDCKDAYEADLHISFLKALDTEEAREFIERFEELKEKFKDEDEEEES